MPLDLFATRTMLQAVEQMLRPHTFLRDTFFWNSRTFETKNIDIDFYRGKRRAAAYVSPIQEGEVVSRLGYTTQTYQPPYIKEKTKTEAGDMLNRTYGETIYAGESPLQRAERQFAIDMMQLDDMITRAEELQCCQALFTGQIILLDGNALVLPQLPTHQITNLAYLWSDKTNSDPLRDARGWRRILSQDSGLTPNVMIFGSSAIDAFLEHPSISNNTGAFSSVKIDRGQIDPEVLPNGVIYWGYIREISCDIYSYDEFYVPSNGSDSIPMVPANKVLMASTNARMDALYGPIQDLEALYAVPRFPKSWVTEDPSVRWLMLQSSPLMIPWQVDAYLWAEVV